MEDSKEKSPRGFCRSACRVAVSQGHGSILTGFPSLPPPRRARCFVVSRKQLTSALDFLPLRLFPLPPRRFSSLSFAPRGEGRRGR